MTAREGTQGQGLLGLEIREHVSMQERQLFSRRVEKKKDDDFLQQYAGPRWTSTEYGLSEEKNTF